MAPERRDARGLLHNVTALLLGLAIYATAGRLLAQRGEDYLVWLQTILPSRLDPLAARLLHTRLFSWTAPLLLPVTALIAEALGEALAYVLDVHYEKALQSDVVLRVTALFRDRGIPRPRILRD